MNQFQIDTPLGPMCAVADNKGLYLLEFIDSRGVAKKIARLEQKTKRPIVCGKTKPIEQIEKELDAYFFGGSRTFQTPLILTGTPFQRRVWEELLKIPPGETRSYADIACTVGKPSAYRAVAQANGANRFAIIIPCHRVINHDGALGGYGGGLDRKRWLLKHER